MATAKQLAARKRFAEMARSGKLATMRKKAAKKNPIDESGVAKRAYTFYYSLRDDGMSVSRAKSETKREFPQLSVKVLSTAIGDAEKRHLSECRAKNPAPKKAVQTKRGGCNPKYAVQIKKGARWKTVAEHTSQSAAETAAKDLHGAGLKAPIRVWG